MNQYGIGHGTPRTLDVILLKPELYEAVIVAMDGDDILFSLPGTQGTIVNDLGDNMSRALARDIIPEDLKESVAWFTQSSSYEGIQIIRKWEE